MSYPGLSLVGFMDQQKAVIHLTQDCVPQNPAPAAVLAEWSAAKANLGPPMPRAGHPDVQPLPPNAQSHIQRLSSQPWVGATLQNPEFAFFDFALVEIDPLLAFQFTINGNRSAHHGSALSRPPSLDQMLELCLPITPPNEDITWQQQDHSVIIRAKSLNVRLQNYGVVNAQFAGIVFGPALPLVQVSEYNGRYYLSNGFHRAYCLQTPGLLTSHVSAVGLLPQKGWA